MLELISWYSLGAKSSTKNFRLQPSWTVYVTISMLGLSRGTIRRVLSITVPERKRPHVTVLSDVLVLRLFIDIVLLMSDVVLYFIVHFFVSNMMVKEIFENAKEFPAESLA